MNYLKLRTLVTMNVNGSQQVQKNSVSFAIPPSTYFTVSPDVNSKPQVRVEKIAGELVYPGEKTYSILHEQELYVATELPIEYWTGFTYKYRVASSCSCKGYRYFSFDLLQILSEDEFINK